MRVDTLRLLLIAEIPTDLATVEASALAIAERLDVLDASDAMYARARHRLDELLDAYNNARTRNDVGDDE